MLKNYTKVVVTEDGDKTHLNDEGQHHRLDGPAIEYSDGTKFWYINGKFHRNIDPATEWASGNKQWLFKGKQHRVGGSISSPQKFWYIHGKEYSKKQYYNKVWNI